MLFENPFLELFTKTPWFMIPIAMGPWICYFISKASSNLTSLELLLYFSIGMILWSFFEYLIHRFLFHGEDKWLGESKFSLFAHFLLHGIHHAFPQDRLRLVFPVFLGQLALHYGFIPLFAPVFPKNIFPALLAGGIFGYVCYDMIHYFMHHLELEKPGYW